jgi:Outer membrane protein beta-barrel domain
MKKLAFLLLAGITGVTANAQFQFGVKAGANFSTLTGADVQDAKTLVSVNGGVFAKLPLTHSISVQPELVYSGQGAKYNDGSLAATQHINYFNVPVLLKYHNFTGFFLETGPQFGFLMSANAKESGVSVDDKNGYKSTDWSWVFGAGYKIPTTRLSIDLRYNLGISNVIDNGYQNNYDGGTAHNGIFQLGLMYVLFSAPAR